MTVPATPRIAGPYLGTAPGTTGPFPFTYPIFYTSDVLVEKNVAGVITTLTLNSDYTVSMNADQTNNPGGTVTLSAAIYTGTTVTLGSQVAQTQSTVLTNLGGFLPSVINNALDKLTILIQQLTTTVLGALSFPLADGNAVSGTLPAQTLRINGGLGSYLFFDGIVGAPGVSSGISSVAVSTALSPVVQAATLGAAAEQLLYGNIASSVPSIVDTNVWSQSTTSVNSYAQDIIQNTSNGAAASTDFVINNNLGTSTTYYGNFGMNSSGYTGAGSFNLANAVYLTSTSGDLAIGTTTANAIHFVYNGSTTDAMTINGSGLTVNVAAAFGSTVTVPNPTGASATQAANIGTAYAFTSGFVNKLRNAGMEIAQRGASGTVSGAYTLDGWVCAYGGSAPAWSQVSNVSLPYGGVARNGLKVTGVAGCTDLQMLQRIESNISAPLSGQTVTFQAVIVNNTASSITPTLTTRIPTAVDNWGGTTTDLAAVNLQPVAAGATVRVSYTFNVGATAYLGYMPLLDFGNGLNNTSNIIVTACDLRLTPGVTTGLNSNPPYPELRNIAHETAFCQRYYEVQTDNVVSMMLATTGSITNQPLSSMVMYKTTKRAIPTITFSNTNTSVNSLALGNSSVQGFSMQGSQGAGYYYCYFNYTASAEL